MKTRLSLIACFSFLFFTLHACPPQINENLSSQFESGILQQRVMRKEIDPHTLIHKAILENSPEVIRFLIQQGVDVDYPDPNGMTPLTMALLNKCTYAVEVLLQYGANVNPHVKWNNTDLLELALAMKDFKSAHLLVEEGANVNVQNKNGYSILTRIIAHARTESAQSSEWIKLAAKMIEKGANIHSNEYGNSPLMEATWLAQIGNMSLLQLMIEKDVDINSVAKHRNGMIYPAGTPLMIAVGSGKLDLVKFLVESGADVNKVIRTTSEENYTPLTYAFEREKPDVICYLLQMGAR